MKKNFINIFFREKKDIILYTLFFVLIFYCIFSLRGLRLNTCNDEIFQYDLFYQEWYRLLESFLCGNGIPTYSWNLYLGGDFLSSMNYYVVGDVFVIILFPLYLLGIELKSLLTFEIYLCIFFSSFNFYLFLEEAKLNQNNKKINIVLSLIYAFGGFSVLFYGQYMFHRTYCFLPLLFYSVEKYFNNKIIYPFIICVFILFLQNFYFMYPISIFLALFCIARLCAKSSNFKATLKTCLVLLVGYLFGFLLSAFITVPGVFYIIHSPRINGSATQGILWPFRTVAQFFISFISSPYPLFTNTNNIFAKSDYYAYWFSNYIGIIPILYSIYFCKRKENKAYLILLLVLIAFALIKPLSSFMHAFNDPCMRWCFIISFYVLFLCANGLNSNVIIPIKSFLIVLFLSIILMLSVYVIDSERITNYSEQILCFGLSTLLSLLIIIFYKKNINNSIFINYLVIYAFTIFLTNIYISERQDNHYDRINKNLLHYYIDVDDDLVFRWYIDEKHLPGLSPINFNNNLYMDVMSNRVYLSTYDYSTTKFDQINNALFFTNYKQISNPYSLTAIGTKYWIVLGENELPKELKFEHAFDLDDMKVYRNMNYLGFGFTLNEIKNIDDINDNSEFVSTLFVDENIDLSKYNNLSYSKFNITHKGSNYLIGNITVDSDNILFIPVPNTKGWKLVVNGNKQDIISVNGGFIGVKLQAGYSEIHLSFSSPYFKESVIISLLTALVLGCYAFFNYKKKEI